MRLFFAGNCNAIEKYKRIVMNLEGPQQENIPWWGNYFKSGGKRAFGGRYGAKYTKYNKINNNSENFGRGGVRLLPGVEFAWPPFSCWSGIWSLTAC